jgi:hypothetical protein
MIVTIQGIPERIQGIRAIKEALAPLDVFLHLDKKREGSLVSFIDMMYEYSTDSYRLHIQDDVILCPNFPLALPLVEAHMRSTGVDIVSLYMPSRQEFDVKYDKGVRGVVKIPTKTIAGVCYIMSPRLQKGLLEFHKSGEYVEGTHDDGFIEEYLVKNRITTYGFLPSLAQHDISVRSSLGHPTSITRTSRVYSGESLDNDTLKKYLSNGGK